MSAVEIAPIVKTLELRRPAADAFRLFTDGIGRWWPTATHARARAAKGERTVDVTIEPRTGGRVFETLADGTELDWGEVLAWQPGALFAMRWQLGRPAEQGTEVSVRFEPTGPDSCTVTLVHAGWEKLGEDATALRGNYDGGWVTVFEEGFGRYARSA